jgi:hypothetical protein
VSSEYKIFRANHPVLRRRSSWLDPIAFEENSWLLRGTYELAGWLSNGHPENYEWLRLFANPQNIVASIVISTILIYVFFMWLDYLSQ